MDQDFITLYEDSARKLESLHSELHAMYTAMTELKPPALTSYSRRSNEELYESLASVRAVAQFAVATQAEALWRKSQVETTMSAARSVLQGVQDVETVRVANQNQERWSWSEREAKVRTRIIEHLGRMRELEELYTESLGLAQAIDTVARGVQRWRQDVTAQIDVLRFGERLSEL